VNNDRRLSHSLSGQRSNPERRIYCRLRAGPRQRIMVACQAGQVFPARQVFPAKAGFFGRQVFENSRSIFFKKM